MNQNLKKELRLLQLWGTLTTAKKTLLDSIRKSKQKIVTGEVGGITQSIGAYTATVNNKKIVFLLILPVTKLSLQ